MSSATSRCGNITFGGNGLSSVFQTIGWNGAAVGGIVAGMGNAALYLGDTALAGAASYLAGVMHAHSITFGYVPCDEDFSPSLVGADCRAVIISDYPARNFSGGQLDSLAERIAAGLGLLMIGGWESFTGLGGDYNTTVLRDVLPVRMQEIDDRVNCGQPCLIEKVEDHEILSSLPFEKNPPGVGGYNRLTSKREGKTLLRARRFEVRFEGGGFVFAPLEQADALLVVGSYGEGRVCAFATDAAPHWVGGLVDWGDARIEACAPGAGTVEVGNWYAELFANMVKWVAGEL